MKVFIAGDTGLLGQALVSSFLGKSDEIRIVGVSTSASSPLFNVSGDMTDSYRHERLNLIEEGNRLASLVQWFAPDVIVNAAALVDLAACEQYPLHAERLHAGVAGDLAKAAKALHARMIQISTDSVFDGKKFTPYTEEDETNPLHVYGRTKLEGEKQALQAYPETLVIRTNIVGFRGLANKPTFGEWLCDALLNHKPITMAEDFITSPIHARTLSEYIYPAVSEKISGILHLASSDACSKFDFAQMLAEEFRLIPQRVTRGKLSDLNLVPPRAPYLALDVSKAEDLLNQTLPRARDTAAELAFESKSRIDFAKAPVFRG